MDSKRLILFIVLSMGILLLWQHYFMPTPAPISNQRTATTPSSTFNDDRTDSHRLADGQRITITTDVLRAYIDTYGGDLRQLELLKYDSATDTTKPFELLTDQGDRIYVAQTGLLDPTHPTLPTHKTLFHAEAPRTTPDGHSIELRLTAPESNGIKVAKVYVFQKGSYLIKIRYEVTNTSTTLLAPTAYYRFLRDGKAPEGESIFAYTFTGPAVYTTEHKFQKVTFDELAKNKANYAKITNNGWVAMLQHYFMSAWLLSPLHSQSVCQNADSCRFELKANNGLYSASVLVTLPVVAPGRTEHVTVPLYTGPEEYKIITQLAEGLEYTKDYGWLHIFASPLFWLLTQLHALVQNWGWAILLLTLLIKAVFYPLTAASYRSMAKMKALAPRLERLKEQHGDDRMKFQQAVMEMYKTEKINPLGGCLPMLIQIPVFIGLYWALLASVELRQAPWIGWITDLARPDPYYALPALLAITMYAQTFLNPPPTDPVQAKMMKIMPVAFSVMFFFFPAGLVLYYLLNNLLSIAQQWYINRQIKETKKSTN